MPIRVSCNLVQIQRRIPDPSFNFFFILWELEASYQRRTNVGQFVCEFCIIFVFLSSLRSFLFGGKFFSGRGQGFFELILPFLRLWQKNKKMLLVAFLKILEIKIFITQIAHKCMLPFSHDSSSELSPQLLVPSQRKVMGIFPHEHWKKSASLSVIKNKPVLAVEML